MDPNVPIDPAADAHRATVTMQRQGLLVSAAPRSDTLINDYDSDWILGSHPSAFPHNTGGCPKGMSEARWAQIILQRYPVRQFAQNVGLVADIFNITQRHSVQTSARVQFKCRPDQQQAVASLTEVDVQTVLDATTSQLFGAALDNSLNTTSNPTAAKTLYYGMKSVGGRVVGTPQSFLSLRSKVCAAADFFGPYTVQLNLSPSETGSEWTFDLAGKSYQLDLDGHPTTRPHVAECKKIIADNPVACAHFLVAYMRAFCHVFLGWPQGADKQENPDCMFGPLWAPYLKYESSGRGGLHAHGQAIMKFLHAINLRKLITDGIFKSQLFGFFESLMCAYFPVPQVPPASTTPFSPSYTEVMPRLADGEQSVCR
jgi:hypothetical protein